MHNAPTIFFDIGGVLLSNGWDTAARQRAATEFQLDYAEFQTRHEMLKTAFETGRRGLDAYVRKAVFHRSRLFSPDEFKQFMFAQSKSLGEALDWVRTLAATGKFNLFTLNNESRVLPGPGQAGRGDLPERAGDVGLHSRSRPLHRRPRPERRARCGPGPQRHPLHRTGRAPRAAQGVRNRRLIGPGPTRGLDSAPPPRPSGAGPLTLQHSHAGIE